MAGKSKRRKYGEFRVFVENRGKGRFRIRPEFVPSMAAYLVMIGRVYQRAIDGMNNRLATDTVPGLPEAVATLTACQRHLQRLLDNLTNHFERDDWAAAVQQICNLMHIQPDTSPIQEILDDTFAHQITEDVNGDDARGS